MTNYTAKNHLKYWIGDKLYGYRVDDIEKFKVAVDPVDLHVYASSSYREELRKTADSVYREFGKDLVLFLSGGTDSEIVARNFLEIGVKPKCAVVRFLNNYNAEEVYESQNIAKELGLDLEIINFDIKDFFNSGEALEFGTEIQCTQLTYLMVYKNILNLGLPAVMGGEVFLSRYISLPETYWYYTFRENEDASAMRFSKKYNIPLVNEWFTYTPELLLYYLEDPGIVDLVTQKYNYKLTSASSKNLILKKLYPGIREKEKSHGFERLMGLNFEAYRMLAASQPARLEPSLDGIRYEDIIGMLRNGN